MNKELYEILKTDVTKFNEWRRNNPDAIVDLRSADLRSADLRSANLRSADLSYANLSYANLRSADLRSADLRSANLSYANLSYANLRSANLRSADLRSANLSYADLRSTSDTILPTGESMKEYLEGVVPALLMAGGKTLEQIISAGAWECHDWTNCPMAEAFSVHDLSKIPALYRPRAEQFVQLFDAGLIPEPVVVPAKATRKTVKK